jgi:uncharacterized membrane protein YbhN (UPF0104 family)
LAIAELGAAVFLIPIMGLAVNTLIHAFRVRTLLRSMGAELRVRKIVGVLCRGSFLGLVLPSGGHEVAKTALLAREGVGIDAAVSAMLGVRLLQLPIWIALLGWGLWEGLLTSDPVLGVAAVFYIEISFLIMVVVARGTRGLGLPTWVPAWISTPCTRMGACADQLRGDPRALIVTALLGIPPMLIGTGVVFYLLACFGHPHAFREVIAFVPAADVLIWLPVSVGGVGVRETVFTIALVPRGVPAATAVAIGLVRWTGELARAGIGCMLWLLRVVSPMEAHDRQAPRGVENE